MRGLHDIYLDAFTNSVNEYAAEAPEFENRKDHVKKAIYYGVKTVTTKEKTINLTKKKAENNFQFASIVKDLIGTLTPGEFENLFPIKKEYDGKKYQSKDYFYTKKYLDTLDPDKPINESEDPLEFLWEYQNWDITIFTVRIMGYMSDLRQLDGYPSISEEWADKEGVIKSPSIYRNNKDERFIVRSGKVELLDNPEPKSSHLRLVK